MASSAGLVAGIIDRLEGRPYGTGRPPLPTVKVVDTFRFFAREGVQWREPRATAGRACSSTLRRRLDDRSATALLRRVHVALVRMVRAGPEPALGRGGRQLSGPRRAWRRADRSQPDRPGQGRDQVPHRGLDRRHPAGRRALGRQRPRHRLFPHPLRLAQGVCAAIGKLYADAAYDSAANRDLCRRDGIQPRLREVGPPHGSGLGAVRRVVEHDCAWLLADKRLDRRQDRLGRVILALLTAACIFVVAKRLRPF